MKKISRILEWFLKVVDGRGYSVENNKDLGRKNKELEEEVERLDEEILKRENIIADLSGFKSRAIGMINRYKRNREKWYDKCNEGLRKISDLKRELEQHHSTSKRLSGIIAQQSKALGDFTEGETLPSNLKKAIGTKDLEKICKVVSFTETEDMLLVVDYDQNVYLSNQNLIDYLGHELKGKEFSSLFGTFEENYKRFLENIKDGKEEIYTGTYNIFVKGEIIEMQLETCVFESFDKQFYLVRVSEPVSDEEGKNYILKKIKELGDAIFRKSNKEKG